MEPWTTEEQRSKAMVMRVKLEQFGLEPTPEIRRKLMRCLRPSEMDLVLLEEVLGRIDPSGPEGRDLFQRATAYNARVLAGEREPERESIVSRIMRALGLR